MNLIIDGIQELPDIARKVLDASGACKVIVFRGEIGAGKTTLIKEICLLLGVTEAVVSPTFGLVNSYMSREGEGQVHHFDWYRIKNEAEAIEIGWEEYVDSGEWLLVEWPEKIGNLLPDDMVDVYLEVLPDGKRDLKLRKYSFE